ncbi:MULTISPECIES: polysaccharide biosynthesis/export family protein [Sphingomonas]|uniref:polysaccharide biosynthesis/export family protein n=1 Tax=Sphingomonas TaxID=13687 RepID=UPI0008378A50|nr:MULTISPECIES: polysaccharide biosynthesis/export family protein [Sphingomonas]MBY0300228.1 polysaccharide export protein [Sphingomonas ginsenosidimutans]
MSRLLALLCFASLSACASRDHQPIAGVTRVADTELPTPGPTDMASAARAYYIGPFDELNITVFGIPDLSAKEVQVDASGKLSFPLVGTLEAAGKTPGEVAAMIDRGLRGHYVRNPSTTVNLVKTVSQVVTVEGEVEKPGIYPVLGRMSLTRAIASAEGTTEFSSLDDVVVLRTISDRQYAALYSLKSIRKGLYADPEIFPNDVVMVGESRGRRIFKDFLAVVPLLTTPIIVALQN